MLKTIPANVFATLKNLRILACESGYLNTLEANSLAFSQEATIDYLILHYNEITVIDANALTPGLQFPLVFLNVQSLVPREKLTLLVWAWNHREVSPWEAASEQQQPYRAATRTVDPDLPVVHRSREGSHFASRESSQLLQESLALPWPQSVQVAWRSRYHDVHIQRRTGQVWGCEVQEDEVWLRKAEKKARVEEDEYPAG